MRNMIWSYNNRGPYLQKKLWRIARANSLYKADGGADPYGWTTATSLAGHGRYVLVASSDHDRRGQGGGAWDGHDGAARRDRRLARDARLGPDRLRGDRRPRATDDFRVITVRMADPLWPYWHVRKRTIYRPGTRLFMTTLKRNFTRLPRLAPGPPDRGQVRGDRPAHRHRSGPDRRLVAEGGTRPDGSADSRPDAEPEPIGGRGRSGWSRAKRRPRRRARRRPRPRHRRRRPGRRPRRRPSQRRHRPPSPVPPRRRAPVPDRVPGGRRLAAFRAGCAGQTEAPGPLHGSGPHRLSPDALGRVSAGGRVP